MTQGAGIRSDETKCAVVTFHRIFSAAPAPMRGDKSALGTLPSAAFQYCEAVRTASSYGWYIFPPVDIRFRWDGADVLYSLGGDWELLASIALSDDFVEDWNQHAPGDLHGCWPPFLTATFTPGVVQIWSGLLVSTAESWSVLIGPPSNLRHSFSFQCYEGIVETDTFKPCPLFINIQLLATDREIVISKLKPLFQVRPVHQAAYSEKTLRYNELIGLAPKTERSGSMTSSDWLGYSKTVRKLDTPPDQLRPGSYGASRRRNAKRDPL